MAKKNELTQIMALEMVIAEAQVEGNERSEDVQAKLVEVYNALVKKKENRKPKQVAEADIVNMAKIKATLEANDKLTVSEIIAKTDFEETLSTSKVTALLQKIEGVDRVKEGKKSLYFLA